MRQALSYCLLVVVGLLACVGFVVGTLLAPFLYGMLRGLDVVSDYIDRNTG